MTKKATGKVEVTRLKNLPDDISKNLSKYNKSMDDKIDPTCKEYKGFKVGQVVYQDQGLLFNHYSEEKILGFTEPLLVGNQFADAEAQAGGFRRIITALTYKGKVEIYSHPPRGYSATLPKYKSPPMCKYCKRRPVKAQTMGGACNNPRCALQAMRDSI